MEIQSIEKENRIRDILSFLRRSSDISEYNQEWSIPDYSKSHLIMMLSIMTLSYVFLIAGYVFTMTQINLDDLYYKKAIIIFQPYLEFFEISVLLFLVHFQYHAFYDDPINILKIISKDLSYSNITKNILFTSTFIALYVSDSIFGEIFKLLATILIFVISVFIYYKLQIINSSSKTRKFKQIVGFNILTSLSLPLYVLEVMNSVVIIIDHYHSTQVDSVQICIIIITVYFLIGSFSIWAIKDIYIGISVAYNLIGVFAVQLIDVCKQYKDKCSNVLQVFSFLYGLTMIFFIGITIYYYPKAYKYIYKSRTLLQLDS